MSSLSENAVDSYFDGDCTPVFLCLRSVSTSVPKSVDESEQTGAKKYTQTQPGGTLRVISSDDWVHKLVQLTSSSVSKHDCRLRSTYVRYGEIVNDKH